MVAHVILVLVAQFIAFVSHHIQAHFVQIEHNIVRCLRVKMVAHVFKIRIIHLMVLVLV